MTIAHDPFALPVPAEEAQQPSVTITAGAGGGGGAALSSPFNSVSTTAVPAAKSSEGEVVLTFKGGTGFDAPWIVIHAADLEDAHRQVTDEAVLLASLMAQVLKAGSHFASNGPVNTGRGGNTSVASAPPLGATEAPSWSPAKHQPDAVYKTGVSKAGKTWHAWMSPQKGGYEPKFFYND